MSASPKPSRIQRVVIYLDPSVDQDSAILDAIMALPRGRRSAWVRTHLFASALQAIPKRRGRPPSASFREQPPPVRSMPRASERTGGGRAAGDDRREENYADRPQTRPPPATQPRMITSVNNRSDMQQAESDEQSGATRHLEHSANLPERDVAKEIHHTPFPANLRGDDGSAKNRPSSGSVKAQGGTGRRLGKLFGEE